MIDECSPAIVCCSRIVWVLTIKEHYFTIIIASMRFELNFIDKYVCMSIYSTCNFSFSSLLNSIRIHDYLVPIRVGPALILHHSRLFSLIPISMIQHWSGASIASCPLHQSGD